MPGESLAALASVTVLIASDGPTGYTRLVASPFVKEGGVSYVCGPDTGPGSGVITSVVFVHPAR